MIQTNSVTTQTSKEHRLERKPSESCLQVIQLSLQVKTIVAFQTLEC
jgi:hypothetical protein